MKALALLFLISALWVTGPAQAQVGSGRDLATFPHSESFDTANYGDILQINPAITTYQHTSGVECFAGGCVKLLLQAFSGEDKSGLGSIRFPAGTTRLNMRWLQKYGTDFVNLIQNEEWKLLILRRGGAARVMVLDWHYSTAGSTRTLRPCLNIDCAPDPNPGKSEFQINSYLGQWISIEMQVDTVTGQAHLFIDTRDGLFNSVGGAAPFATKSITAGAVVDIDILAGYWEGSSGSSPNHYLMIDELQFNTGYIGPPPGFGLAPSDGGVPQDQGAVVQDAAMPDSTTRDAVVQDAGVIDAAAPDASTPDAVISDAAPPADASADGAVDLSSARDRGSEPADAMPRETIAGGDSHPRIDDTAPGSDPVGSAPLDGGCCDLTTSSKRTENLWLPLIGVLALGLRRRRAR